MFAGHHTIWLQCMHALLYVKYCIHRTANQQPSRSRYIRGCCKECPSAFFSGAENRRSVSHDAPCQQCCQHQHTALPGNLLQLGALVSWHACQRHSRNVLNPALQVLCSCTERRPCSLWASSPAAGLTEGERGPHQGLILQERQLVGREGLPAPEELVARRQRVPVDLEPGRGVLVLGLQQQLRALLRATGPAVAQARAGRRRRGRLRARCVLAPS